MIKIYESNTVISGLTLFVKGQPIKVSFIPVSPHVSNCVAAMKGICSRLQTCNTEVQAALERHPLFGSHITLVQTIGTPEKPKSEKAPAKKEPKPKEVKVTSPAEAREYLVKEYGIDPKKIGLLNAIKAQAKRLGFEFVGI